MILSRRQRESLLDEMAKMIANKQNVAFANCSKISERVSNNDLSFYINSIDKQFVIKYSNNTMLFNCKEKTFSELNALIFSNKNKITGISDTSKNDSNVALSTRWAYNKDVETLKRMKKYNPEGISGSGTVDIIGITDDNTYSQQHLLTYEYWKDHQEKKDEQQEEDNDNKYALKDHIHQQYALKDHIHQQYADKNHTHQQYADKTHTHPEYSLTTHTHSEYATQSQLTQLNLALAGKANVNHSHDGLWSKSEIIDLIEDETKTPWYEKLFKGLDVIGEIAQDGYIFALQSQINALYSAMAANGIVDTAQTITGVGALVQGVASKFSAVANGLDWIGTKFPKLANTISKITGPLRTVANHIAGYQEIIDTVLDIGDQSGLTDLLNTTAHHINHTGTIDDMMKTKLLPDTFDTLTQGTTTSGNIIRNGYTRFN